MPWSCIVVAVRKSRRPCVNFMPLDGIEVNCILLMCFKTIATVLEQFRLLKGQKAMNSKSSLFEGCLLGGRKYHSTKKVLVYMQKFRSLWLIVQKELKIKACCIIIVYFLLFSLFEKDTERLKLFFVIGLMITRDNTFQIRIWGWNASKSK